MLHERRPFLEEWAHRFIRENSEILDSREPDESLRSFVIRIGESREVAYRMLDKCPAAVLGRMIDEIPANRLADDRDFSSAHSMVRCIHGFRDIQTLTASGSELLKQLAAIAVIAEAVDIVHENRVPERYMQRVA